MSCLKTGKNVSPKTPKPSPTSSQPRCFCLAAVLLWCCCSALLILTRLDRQATRQHSENVLNCLAGVLPEIVGGSADLTPSNLTNLKSSFDFQRGGDSGAEPASKKQKTDSSASGSYAGRYIRFGVREHAMAAVCNGMAAYGALLPFCATFLNFTGYALGAVSGNLVRFAVSDASNDLVGTSVSPFRVPCHVRDDS